MEDSNHVVCLYEVEAGGLLLISDWFHASCMWFSGVSESGLSILLRNKSRTGGSNGRHQETGQQSAFQIKEWVQQMPQWYVNQSTFLEIELKQKMLPTLFFFKTSLQSMQWCHSYIDFDIHTGILINAFSFLAGVYFSCVSFCVPGILHTIEQEESQNTSSADLRIRKTQVDGNIQYVVENFFFRLPVL